MDLQAIINRIETLCRNKNVSVNKMLSELELSSSTLINMKKGSIPSIDKIIAIAQYFDVSVDYILCVETADKQTQKNIYTDFFSSLSDEELKKIYEIAKLSLDR